MPKVFEGRPAGEERRVIDLVNPHPDDAALLDEITRDMRKDLVREGVDVDAIGPLRIIADVEALRALVEAGRFDDKMSNFAAPDIVYDAALADPATTAAAERTMGKLLVFGTEAGNVFALARKSHPDFRPKRPGDYVRAWLATFDERDFRIVATDTETLAAFPGITEKP